MQWAVGNRAEDASGGSEGGRQEADGRKRAAGKAGGREGGRQEADGRESGRQEVGSGRSERQEVGGRRWRVRQVAGAWRRKILPGGEKREKAGWAHGMLGVRKGRCAGSAGNEKAILAKAQW